ncbi:MAG: DUF4965 domain-containing protein [Limnochordales bacterium]|nr:DUF4965 domain-containing protein [Limnochordales bacterium]
MMAMAAADQHNVATRLAPALPLIVNDPYISVWSATDHPAQSWPEHWSGRLLPMSIAVRIDGNSYNLLGIGGAMKDLPLESVQITSCKTIYSYEAPGVGVQLSFISPKDMTDLQTLALPLSLVELRIFPLDGRQHSVDWFFGITGMWSPGKGDEIKVAPIKIKDTDATVSGEDLGKADDNSPRPDRAPIGFLLEPPEQSPFEEDKEWPLWGTTAFVSLGGPRLVKRDSSDASASSQNVDLLVGTMRELQDSFGDGTAAEHVVTPGEDLGWETVGRSTAFAMQVTGFDVPGDGFAVWRMAIGNVHPTAAVLRDDKKPLGVSRLDHLWRAYFGDYNELLSYVVRHQDDLIEAASTTDQTVERLAALLAHLVFRQTLGAYVLVTDGENNFMLGKEISSGGFVQTVDVIFPASPLFLVLNAELLKMQLEPVFRFVESGRWLEPFAPHDLGRYPVAMGQAYGAPMPLEESGNMLLLAAAVWKETQDGEFVRRHYATLRAWAQYLADHGEDPEEQVFTDDFTGPSARNAHLSLKALLGVGAFARLAEAVGEDEDARLFSAKAQKLKVSWLERAWAGDHFVRIFGDSNSWCLPYNLLFDEYLGLGMIPRELVDQEIRFLLGKSEKYGIPLEDRFKYTKADWLMWVAAIAKDPAQREAIVGGILRMLRESPNRVPFTDWYDTQNATNRGFRARPVMGGVYAPILISYTAEGK